MATEYEQGSRINLTTTKQAKTSPPKPAGSGTKPSKYATICNLTRKPTPVDARHKRSAQTTASPETELRPATAFHKAVNTTTFHKAATALPATASNEAANHRLPQDGNNEAGPGANEILKAPPVFSLYAHTPTPDRSSKPPNGALCR